MLRRNCGIQRRNFLPGQLDKWYSTLFEIYGRMKTPSSSYELDCGDMTLIVLPNVYAPRFFTDSLWFATELSDIVRDGSLLEIGSGTGIVTLHCARRGARVVATDVNPAAVRNTRLNGDRLELDIEVREGSVYDALEEEQQFDFIFWAHPFNNWPSAVGDMLLRSGFDHNYDGLREYVGGASKHLTSSGRLLLGTGDSADLDTVASISEEHGYSLELLKNAEMPLTGGGDATIKYLVLELVSI